MNITRHVFGLIFTLSAVCPNLASALRADEVDLAIGTEPAFRLRISLAAENETWGEHFQRLQNRYYELLFQRLDADDDNRLSEAEAKRAPAPLLRLGARPGETHVAFNFRVLDDDGDGQVTRSELKTFYEDYATGAIGFGRARSPGGAGRTTALFERLDADGDAFLSQDEIRAAEHLWKFDRDGDGQLSLPGLQIPVAVSGSGEFIAKTPPYAFKPLKDLTVKPSIAGPDAPPAEKQFKFRLSKSEPSQLVFEETEGARVDGGRIVTRKDDLLIVMSTEPRTLRILEQTSEVLRREVASLAGEKEITDETAFPGFLRGHADLIDSGADGKLTREELESYLADLLPARIAAESGRLMIRTSPLVTGLFAYLDRNHDGLLSKAELSQLETAFKELDADRDQKLSQAEIPWIVRIEIAMETPPPPYLSADQRNAGPPWFYRLDKNQDGTLTPAEFPGRPELFERLDRDGNQIISLEEAFAAEKAFPQKRVLPDNQGM